MFKNNGDLLYVEFIPGCCILDHAKVSGYDIVRVVVHVEQSCKDSAPFHPWFVRLGAVVVERVKRTNNIQ